MSISWPATRQPTTDTYQKTTEVWNTHKPSLRSDGVYEHCHSPNIEDSTLNQKIALICCIQYNLKAFDKVFPSHRHQSLESLKKDFHLLNQFPNFPNQQIHSYLKEKFFELSSQFTQGELTLEAWMVSQEPTPITSSHHQLSLPAYPLSSNEGTVESPINIPESTPSSSNTPTFATRKLRGEYEGANIPEYHLGAFELSSLKSLAFDKKGKLKKPKNQPKIPPHARKKADGSYEVFSTAACSETTEALSIREGVIVITHYHGIYKGLSRSYSSERLEKICQNVINCIERLQIERGRFPQYKSQYDQAIKDDRARLDRLRSLQADRRAKKLLKSNSDLAHILN